MKLKLDFNDLNWGSLRSNETIRISWPGISLKALNRINKV